MSTVQPFRLPRLTLIVQYLPRDKGNGWKVSKFHDIKHVVRFIGVSGASRGYNASRPAKHPGRHSQKNMNTINKHCDHQITDTIAIDTMHGLFQRKQGQPVKSNIIDTEAPTLRTPFVGMKYDGDKPTIEEGRGTMYCIRSLCDQEKSDGLFQEVKFNTQTRGPSHLEDYLYVFTLQHYGSSDINERGEGSVTCCTEYKKTDATTSKKMIRSRCHPN
jgi:hypothetical protein